MDIGLPHNYLLGTQLFLQHLQEAHSTPTTNFGSSAQGSGEVPYRIFENEKSVTMSLAEGPNIIGAVLIHHSAQVDPSAVLGPDVVVGRDCKIGAGTRISNSTILPQTEIKRHAFIRNSIIGWQNVIGQWVRIEGVSVVAQDVQVKDEVFINESMILPHKNI